MNMYRVVGGNIGILFGAMYNQQTHIVVLKKLTCYVGVYVGAQRPHSQKYEEVNLLSWF